MQHKNQQSLQQRGLLRISRLLADGAPDSLFNADLKTAKRPSVNQYIKMDFKSNGILPMKPMNK